MRLKCNWVKWVFALAAMLVLGTTAYGEEKYTVSGIVTFS